MKRDAELIRSLLLKVWSTDRPTTTLTTADDDRKDWPRFREHVLLAVEGGLLSVVGTTKNPSIDVRLTASGQDFCEEVQNDSRWRKVLEWLTDRGIPATVNGITTAAAKITAEQMLGR